MGVMMKQSADLLLSHLEKFHAVLKRRAAEHKHTIMIGRTHGIHAEPMTFGLKFALWMDETERNIERLKQITDFRSHFIKRGTNDRQKYLSKEEIEACFDPKPMLRHVDLIMSRFGL